MAEPSSSPATASPRRQSRSFANVHFRDDIVQLLQRSLDSCRHKSRENNSTDRLTIEIARYIFNHMVEQRLDATFQALADPTRRGMLATLALGERSIGELAEPYAMSFAGAAKHVKVLEGAGLVARRKVGRTQLCRLEAGPLGEADAWLKQWEQFWNVRLDRLEALIKAEKKP